jgi:alpha-ketoglutarate-dependent taurine dioxygenase
MPELLIRPLSDALGAEVLGIDATVLDDEIFARIRDAFHDNIVLVIRDQALTPAEQTAFARRFGDIQYHINPEYLMPDQPEVMVLSNEKKDGKPLGVANAGADWHSDHSYVDQPTGYSILQSVKVPKIGGDTEWINMVKAYETLPDDLKKRIDGLVGIHSFNRGKTPARKPLGARTITPISMPNARRPMPFIRSSAPIPTPDVRRFTYRHVLPSLFATWRIVRRSRCSISSSPIFLISGSSTIIAGGREIF